MRPTTATMSDNGPRDGTIAVSPAVVTADSTMVHRRPIWSAMDATGGIAEHVAQTGNAQHESRGTSGIAAPGQVEHDEHGQEVADPVDQDAKTDDPHPAGQAAQRVAESRLDDGRPDRRRGAHATGSM